MGVFERKYGEPLQAVVDHARRLCALLECLESVHPDPGRWLVGRQDEIRLVVRLRVRDWRARRIGTEFAARTIGAYLDEIHLGAMRSLGLPANVPLDCCTPGEATTVPIGTGRTPAIHAELHGSRCAPAGETWLDLRALLDLAPLASKIREFPPDENPELDEQLLEARANRS
ncbi:MAG TPA: hypothetical protein VGM06_13270 [Polyangiaceae bacterium]|jgi:hypothetical protein